MSVVNFDDLAQTSDFRIERRQVVFLYWCRIRTQGLRHLIVSRLSARWQTNWAITDQAKENLCHNLPLFLGFVSHGYIEDICWYMVNLSSNMLERQRSGALVLQRWVAVHITFTQIGSSALSAWHSPWSLPFGQPYSAKSFALYSWNALGSCQKQ